jgi:galactose mutarotase-like enzyme
VSRTHLAHGDYALEIAALGAELQSLRWRGEEYLWQGDPAWWSRRAPVLFPTVGGLKQNRLRHRGSHYPMPKHGFARDHMWTLIHADDLSCEYELRDDAETHQHYPFAFALTQRFALSDTGLEVSFRLHNPNDHPLPAGLGGHPAFRWPLREGVDRNAHQILFDLEEPHPIRRVKGAFLDETLQPNPVKARTLSLHDALFENDAVILDRVQSLGLRFHAPGAPALRFTWDFPHFAIWTKPGAPFLCLEPWQGYVDPVNFDGEFMDKPGIAILDSGETRSWSYGVSLEPPTLVS